MAMIHVAGPVVDLRQDCSRCGYTLEDWSGVEAYSAIALGESNLRATDLPFWEPGIQVAVDGNATWVAGLDDIRTPMCEEPI